ncbi:MAG: hypothetical protein IJ873_04625 [Lachnospiraceae bacterium]|nr:hypothetical protein [Lachnospiraceae bacterium]
MGYFEIALTSFIDFLTGEGTIFRIEIEVEPGLQYYYQGNALESYFEGVSYAVG